MPQGAGRIRIFSDFVGSNGSAAVLGPNIEAFGVGTETYAATVDEAGGVFAFATGASDNDNAVLRSGPFAPRDGKMRMIARFKLNNTTTLSSVFVGFSETLDSTTPVMPAEFATATMTYNGTGGMVGLQFDIDGTTDDFRAVMGDGGAAISDSGSGIRANATNTADRYYEVEVVINEDGSAECWLGDVGHANSDGMNKLRMIKNFHTGTLLDPTNLFFACLMQENRTAASVIMEVDYFGCEAGRDWRAA